MEKVNRLKNAAIVAVTLGTAAVSQAAVDTNVTGIVDDTETFVGTLFPLKATIVVAGIAFGLVKFLRR